MPALAKKLCRCQPSASLNVATSAPPPVFSIPISRARLVGGLVVLADARVFSAVVAGLVGVLRFDLAVIFASSSRTRANPAPLPGQARAAPGGSGACRIARFPCTDTDVPVRSEVQFFIAWVRGHLSVGG